MPFQQKAKHDDDQLDIIDVEEVEVVLHQLSDDKEEALTRYFAPKSSIAKELYEKRLDQQNRKKAWMDTILRKQMDLQLNLQRIQEMAAKSRNQSGTTQPISPLHLVKVTANNNSQSSIAI
jgi:hypothetical protein